ncbi:MAG: putative thymidylate kinase [Parcubacteria group bacterium GW2011_GWA2_31_28]|nr:MAG: putative thymidylate kinase [Parcubacteria group bacterium GW2011_GWA2_31_28]
MKNSLFIVLDGLDGSGKGEMVNSLASYLESKGHKVLKTTEPTNSEYGRKAKEISLKEDDPMKSAEECLKLYTQDREEHLKNEIIPALEQGITVISDRYYYSTIAYQNAQGIALTKVIEANKGFRKPDIAFILDIPARLALERISKRGIQVEKFEKYDFIVILRDKFLNLFTHIGDNIKVIDASKSKEHVFNQIKREVDKIV